MVFGKIKLGTASLELMKGGGVALVLRGFATLLVLVFNAVVARYFGASELGLYFKIIGLVLFFSIFAVYGTDTALLKNVVSDKTEFYLRKYLVATSIRALAITLIVVVAISFDTYVFEPLEKNIARIGFFSIWPTSITILGVSYFRGLKKAGATYFLQHQGGFFIYILLILSVFIISYYAGGIEALIIVHTSIVTANAMMCVYLLRKKIAKTSSIHKKEELNHFFYIALFTFVAMWVPTYILESNADVSIFNISQRLANLINFVVVAVAFIASPNFAKLYDQKDYTGLKNMLKNARAVCFIVSILPALLLIFGADYILNVFGQTFTEGKYILMLLVVGQLLNAAFGLCGNFLLMTNKQRVIGKITIVSSVISVVLCLILVPYYGGLGAAVAIVFGQIILQLFSWFYASRSVKNLLENVDIKNN